MKLKALKPRLHNAMFHTHTVSGIVISFALFVCFYAGAFSLFLKEMYPWENPGARVALVDPATVDYDKIIADVVSNYDDLDATANIGLTPPTSSSPLVHLYGRKKTEDDKFVRFNASINPNNNKVVSTGEETKTHMGATIYQLHFFRQIPVVGVYLSGLVAFFFLFAIVTGVLTHWKNIVNKFYAFTVKGKWKQIWTNGHVSLGFITLPFQLIFALTGALLCLNILILAPSAFLMFNGDTNKVIEAVRPDYSIKYDDKAKSISNGHGFNEVYRKVIMAYPQTEITYLSTQNYGKEDGTITARIDDHKGIGGDGMFIYSYKDGTLLDSIEPETRPYAKGVLGVLGKLHYGFFGGLFLKIVYFILAMITCYIIISGVMIWRTARDNKKYTDKQRRFHHRVTKVYLAICLSMFPGIALLFIANKLVPMEMEDRVFYVNSTFFWGWLALTILGLFWNNYRILNRNYLLLGSGLGILIPVANGLVTGDWLWSSFINQQYYVFSVDFTWLVIGVLGVLIVGFHLRKKLPGPSNSSKERSGDAPNQTKTEEKEELEPIL